MGLWAWTLAVYDRPGVQDLLLGLQDEAGQSPPFLLWAAWAAPVEDELLTRAAAFARAWEDVATAPLRAARRAMKARLAPIPDAGRETLRNQVKGVELASERLLMETLEGLAPAGGGDRLAALQAAARAWGRPAPAESLAALADALR